MKPARHLLSLAAAFFIATSSAVASTAPAGTDDGAGTQAPRAAEHRPVLFISIDGLSPDSLFAQEEPVPDVPVLRGLIGRGSYAERVVNVNPTVTNPNHTSLVTGVSPARHGVFNNRPFAPTAKLPGSYRDYGTIKVPTLWSAAKQAGLRTASLYWPVTRGAGDIDVNVIDGDSKDDARITQDALRILDEHGPHLMTVHYVTHDSAQHAHGPGSAAGIESLELIDKELGKLIPAFQARYLRGVVAVVSDHGFDRTTREVNLNIPFADAGFITFTDDSRTEVASWRAFVWYVGASAMVVLNDPQDRALEAEVRAFLTAQAQRPDSGISGIIGPEGLGESGLSDQARFVIALKPGYRMGSAMSGPYATAYSGGSHGAFTTPSTRTDMHSAFILVGDGIAPNANLGTIDLRRIAPTIAQLLNVPLETAQAKSLLGDQ